MRPDLDIVAEMVGSGVRVLDLGCGDGDLLDHLIRRQGCEGHGVERDVERFHTCVARGVPVTQGDLEAELELTADDAYDCAVLSLTLQATTRPDRVLESMRRVAPRRVVSLPNFGHWRLRLDLAARGRMPVTRILPHSWYDTPNIHLCTLADFEQLAESAGMRTARRVLLDEAGRPSRGPTWARPNLLAVGAVYLLEG
ncbi:MAG TPA: methionine biosynthesis protein MetW [Solirubrobacterales bacterium]|nr:methionine biosynthesis protein MetW [Solirubrobacterales bacterium]